MAYTYEKSDPKNPDLKRWMGVVRIGTSDVRVSLRMKVRSNTRVAEQRLNDLQREIDNGVLTDGTKGWLGGKTFTKLQVLVGLAGIAVEPGSPTCWESALKGYLRAVEARDTVAAVAGKLDKLEKTKIARRQLLNRFHRWLVATGEKFQGRPFTDIHIDYIKHRRSLEIKATTLWGADYPYILLWGDWLASRNLFAKPDRDRIREFMPAKPRVTFQIPSWQEDVAALQFFYDHRHTHIPGPNWRLWKRYWCAWCLVLVVRGLGCRPSEATALKWSSVHLDENYVWFLDRKTGKDGKVPILYQWVKDGLVEAWNISGRKQRGDGAVCLNTDDRPWYYDTTAATILTSTRHDHKLPLYPMKKMQKLWIEQTVRLGFPPHVVAYWNDHTLAVAERHYMLGDAYLPEVAPRDYGRFGPLSGYGKLALARWANPMGQLESPQDVPQVRRAE